MVLSIDESKKKYAEYIKTVGELKVNLENEGYEVLEKNNIELESTYFVNLAENKIARIWWSVPHYLEFEPYVEQNESAFSIDYIKNLNDWTKFISDIQNSLSEYASKNNPKSV